ncbi:hypothetical protein ZWY2020_037558 [Hordeum vulgare]|nr:hypothetical protein ZWY2020_037558 [Hordeum vulgare]
MSSSSVESEDGRSMAAVVVGGDGSSRNLLDRAYPQEVWRRGGPCLRPERSRVLLARTPSMDALEARYRQCAWRRRGGCDTDGSPGQHRGMLWRPAVGGEHPGSVSPHDLWLFFSTEEKCSLVLQSSMKFKCCRRWIQFHRWVREIRATPAGLEYKTKLSFEGLPDQAWSMQSVIGVLKDLGADLIEMILPKNRRELEVTAWLRDPSKVAKLLDVKIPEPKLALCTHPPPESLDEFVAREEASSYGPSSPKKKKTLVYPVIYHLKEVVDRGPLLAEDLPDEWLPNEGEDLTRTHKFSIVLCKIDGNVD